MNFIQLLLSPLLVIASITQLYSQTLLNGGFEQRCDSFKTGLCYWDLSWGGKNTCSQGALGSNHFLLIKGRTKDEVGFAEQSVLLKKLNGLQIVILTAKIGSDSITGRGAGLNLAVYDSSGNFLLNKDMGYASYNWVKGTTTCKEYTLNIVCPQNAAKIKVGAILYGKGKARFDDYKLMFTYIEGRKPSALAIEYISKACDTIAKHSLVRDSINIKALKSTALQIAGQAKNYTDCHLAVEYLLASLRNYGDVHSFFMKPNEVKAWEGDSVADVNTVYAKYRVINGYGYILVPHFDGDNNKLMIAFADSIQAGLRKLNEAGIKGWIIDLRENTGGSQEPMIAGLGPIFNTERLGSLVDADGKKESWFYKNGTYYWEKEAGITVTNPVLLSQHFPIAVLIGPRTGSAGEVITISFIGNANTKTFGLPTWGLTTGNGSFSLPDGAIMKLSSTVMADRNGNLFHGKIEPDEKVEAGDNTNEDYTIKAAIHWLVNGH